MRSSYGVTNWKGKSKYFWINLHATPRHPSPMKLLESVFGRESNTEIWYYKIDDVICFIRIFVIKYTYREIDKNCKEHLIFLFLLVIM